MRTMRTQISLHNLREKKRHPWLAGGHGNERGGGPQHSVDKFSEGRSKTLHIVVRSWLSIYIMFDRSRRPVLSRCCQGRTPGDSRRLCRRRGDGRIGASANLPDDFGKNGGG